jgi:hypothetical protein
MDGREIVGWHFEVSNWLGQQGFAFSRALAHAVEFEHPSFGTLYLKPTQKISVAFDPERVVEGKVLAGSRGYESWNADFSKFPRKQRGGERPEKFGLAFDFSDVQQLRLGVSEAMKGAV